MNTPLVSIAIPVFNGANFMRDAIDSLLAQTYPNLEVLLVNDGSDDGGASDRIAQSYGDKIRYFQQGNRGVSSALNLALKNAKGSYFGWLSHDDIYLPQKVAREVALLKSLQDGNAVVFCHHAVMDPRGNLLTDQPPKPTIHPQRAAYDLILDQRLHCCTVLAPTEAYLELGGFREDLPTTQDYDLLVRMAMQRAFYEVPEILLWARVHPGQGSATLKHQHEIGVFFDEHIPLLDPAYIHGRFVSEDSISAFVALAREMRRRGLRGAADLTCRQLIRCEAGRSDPDLLWNAVSSLLHEDLVTTTSTGDSCTHSADSGNPAHGWVKKVARDWFPPIIWRGLSLLKHRLSRGKPRNAKVAVAGHAGTRQTARLDFDNIYNTNGFVGTESRSGEGSTLYQTRIIREELPLMLRELDVRHLLDVPCGDWNWMRYVKLDGVFYTGGDVVQAIVDRNREAYGSESVNFQRLDITAGPFPKADLIFCRDCLVHLSFADGLSAIEQFRSSGARWLLTTTFDGRDENEDLYEGHIWRPLNLELAPYKLGHPVRLIREGCTEGDGAYADKCLGLWRIDAASQ